MRQTTALGRSRVTAWLPDITLSNIPLGGAFHDSLRAWTDGTTSFRSWRAIRHMVVAPALHELVGPSILEFRHLEIDPNQIGQQQCRGHGEHPPNAQTGGDESSAKRAE
jgi:hypothetical protein